MEEYFDKNLCYGNEYSENVDKFLKKQIFFQSIKMFDGIKTKCLKEEYKILKKYIEEENTGNLSFLKILSKKYIGIEKLHFDWMYGYKILYENFKSPVFEFKYKAGKKYSIENNKDFIPILERNGFHFCKSIDDLKYHCVDTYDKKLFYVKGFVLMDEKNNPFNIVCNYNDKNYFISEYNDMISSSKIQILKELDIDKLKNV